MQRGFGIAITAALAAVSSAALLAACSSTGPAAKLAPARPWKDLDREERIQHMKTFVLPGMKLEFAALDASRFGAMDCTTCHGESARDGDFAMPNPRLPQLPGGADGFEKLLAEEPEMTAFMANVVVPKMAAMLGETPYDPKTHAGFGCFRCHTKGW